MMAQTRQTILIATTNAGKLRELKDLLKQFSQRIDWLSLRDFPDIPEVIEDGESFAANARKKALGYAKATGLWTIADDSGLVVDALDGAPGVFSARYAVVKNSPPAKGTKLLPCEGEVAVRPEGFDAARGYNRKQLDIANFQKVLKLLKDVPDKDRTAHFMCHLCLASPEKILLEATGTVDGIITRSPMGENGFGYDPIFYIPSLQKTAAQLTDNEKNKISHRGSAIRNFKPLLQELLLNP